MNYFSIVCLKTLRKLYSFYNIDSNAFGRNWKIASNKEYANRIIYDLLKDEKPCMIARFGATEMLCLSNYIGVHDKKNRNLKNYIKGLNPPWWWETSMLRQMQLWSGFFPPNINNIEKFCKLMINDISQIDILGSWLKEESIFQKELKNTKKVMLEDLEPFFTSNPWTLALEGKKILIVHPFVKTIIHQYEKRELLFENKLLPQFELKTIEAVQSIAGTKTRFSDWFEALNYMKEQINQIDYDICIIGAGAYGFPLAAHVKRMGKKSIHLAGVTQLLFGIKGKRWEEYIVWPYTNLYNEHWIRPSENEKPKNSDIVENSCYW